MSGALTIAAVLTLAVAGTWAAWPDAERIESAAYQFAGRDEWRGSDGQLCEFTAQGQPGEPPVTTRGRIMDRTPRTVILETPHGDRHIVPKAFIIRWRVVE